MTRSLLFPFPHAGALVGALFAAVLLLGACDTSVDVIDPFEQYQYSLFGTLNVATDTQVIRVEPLGDSTQIGAPRALDATVVLENLGTGTEVALNDSFTAVGGGIAEVHNLWTTASITPGTQYRISIRRNGETVTKATTTTPARPPDLRHRPDAEDDSPFLLPCDANTNGNPTESENSFSVRVTETEVIAAAEAIYPLSFLPRTQSTIGHLGGVTKREPPGSFDVSVYYGQDLFNLNNLNPSGGSGVCVPRSGFVEPHALLAVTTGGPDWPPWLDAPLNDLARPDTFSNVDGGHGFIGGVYTDTIRVPIQQRQ
jgi:hypothetical protein